ncbi:MAG: hypothetical protein QF918_12015 [Pirellulaceae bacterium]|nr:hypothetical protein [Pirellulaceae bacterium]MDP6557173.1 hypothetical protein [Pirellulaceae bacterium]MDP6718694.1 hypothetical protein [Pirellulaceae bacterium]
MSQPSSADVQPTISDQPMMGEQPQVEAPTQKQRINVYTMMLVIAFVCLVTACILLYQELTLWGSYPWWNTDAGKPNVSYVEPSGSHVERLVA